MTARRKVVGARSGPSRGLRTPGGPFPETVLAVDRPRPVGLERHLRLVAAVGADDVVHLPRPAVEPSSAASASISIHVSISFRFPWEPDEGDTKSTYKRRNPPGTPVVALVLLHELGHRRVLHLVHRDAVGLERAVGGWSTLWNPFSRMPSSAIRRSRRRRQHLGVRGTSRASECGA